MRLSPEVWSVCKASSKECRTAMMSHHLWEVLQIVDVFGGYVPIPLLDHDEVDPGGSVSRTSVCGRKVMSPGVECHHGKVLQELLRRVCVFVVGALGSSHGCGKVTEPNTVRLMLQTCIEASPQNPAVSSWKSFEGVLQNWIFGGRYQGQPCCMGIGTGSGCQGCRCACRV